MRSILLSGKRSGEVREEQERERERSWREGEGEGKGEGEGRKMMITLPLLSCNSVFAIFEFLLSIFSNLQLTSGKIGVAFLLICNSFLLVGVGGPYVNVVGVVGSTSN